MLGAGVGLGASTGTEVTGISVRSGLWLKRQWGRVQRGFSGHGRVWNSLSVGNMMDCCLGVLRSEMQSEWPRD